jgi:hypothetical protein
MSSHHPARWGDSLLAAIEGDSLTTHESKPGAVS